MGHPSRGQLGPNLSSRAQSRDLLWTERHERADMMAMTRHASSRRLAVHSNPVEAPDF